MWKMRTYFEWESYLANGRKKYERTLYDRGLRIQHANKFKRGGNIEIVMPWLNNFPIITIHPDNTMTLNGEQTTTIWGHSFNPLKAQSTRYTLWKYAGIEVVQRNFKFQLYEVDAPLTPVKIQGCRTCNKTGRVDGWCNGKVCWDIDDRTGLCSKHPEVTISDTERQRGRHMLLCEHNEKTSHKVPRGYECYSCQGIGKRDYGSKRVSLLWDGSPIKVKDRKIYKQPLTDLERIVAEYVGPTSNV